MEKEAQNQHRYRNALEFVKVTQKAIALERKEESEQFQRTIEENPTKELQNMGLAVANLRVKSLKTGLYGRRLVTLARPGYSRALVQSQKNIDKVKIPDCRFGVGDNVGLYDQAEYVKGKPLLEGVVHNKLQFKITVSFEDSEEVNEEGLENKNLCICSTTNEVTYNRYSRVLGDIEKAVVDQVHPSVRVVRTLFDYIKYERIPLEAALELEDKSINEEQKKAIQSSLESQSVHLIHGPPGTGKTKTVCELIVQAVKRGWKVLACAGSNVAVDNIVERINGSKGVRPCRIGHPSRMLQSVYEFCLDSQVQKTSSQKLLRQQKHRYDQLKSKYIKTTERQLRRQLKDEMMQVRGEIKTQEEVGIKQVLDESNVICCTNTGAADRVFNRELFKTVFDLVVIDECAQAVEVSCWLPILKGRRLVLAGDHKQLPPTIKCKNSQDLAYTLFDRAMTECPVTSTLLSTQYRMNSAIMEWSSQQFYEGKLIAHGSVSEHTINGCVKELQEIKAPLMLIDTAGSKMGENLDREDGDLSKSKFNVGEADIVKVVYLQLKDHGLLPSQIGVITPYNAQVNLIKQLLVGQAVEISTVDGFQGRQKECIIISMVRSNPKKVVGFLAEERRMNVAITRARRFVCLIGDSETVSSDPFLKTLVDYFNIHAQHRTANDFSDDPRVRFGMGYTEHSQAANSTSPTIKKQNPKKKKQSKREESDNIKELDDAELDKLMVEVNKPEPKENRPEMPALLEQRRLMEKYAGVMQGFMESSDQQFKLEGLQGKDRRVVHILATQLNLFHQTSFDKKTLTLQKIPEHEKRRQQEAKLEAERLEMVQRQRQKELERKKLVQVEQSIKQRKAELLEFHEHIMSNTHHFRGLGGQERQVVRKLAEQLGLQSELSSNKKVLYVFRNRQRFDEEQEKKGQEVKRKEKKAKIAEEDDEQEILRELGKMIEDNKRCHFPQSECKANVLHLGQHCKFCNQMFCTKHILAEQHGCDEAAKKDAIDRFRKEGKAQEPKSNPATRYKLHERVKKMQEGRKGKKPEKK